eukprot:TRINITY_DN2523_c1_g1_i3.p1 TRINITY_DN2523_c1_g1~~TRINITY_DN2523_c1_g1_i3.p1  ORF type:complete len:214 (-),score=34.18 TRINITY_DN2523_c1_g1_i3:39-680(-)
MDIEQENNNTTSIQQPQQSQQTQQSQQQQQHPPSPGEFLESVDNIYVPGPRTRAQERTLRALSKPSNSSIPIPVAPVVASPAAVTTPSGQKRKHKLSALEELISYSIEQVGKRATIDEIEEIITPIFPTGLDANGQAYPTARYAIVICLTRKNDGTLFRRTSNWFTKWELAPTHPWEGGNQAKRATRQKQLKDKWRSYATSLCQDLEDTIYRV